MEEQSPESSKGSGYEKPSRKKGWFSRNHQDPAAHQQASAQYQAEHGRAARQRKADEQGASDYYDKMSLTELAHRLGQCDEVSGRGVEERRERIQDAIERQRT